MPTELIIPHKLDQEPGFKLARKLSTLANYRSFLLGQLSLLEVERVHCDRAKKRAEAVYVVRSDEAKWRMESMLLLNNTVRTAQDALDVVEGAITVLEAKEEAVRDMASVVSREITRRGQEAEFSGRT